MDVAKRRSIIEVNKTPSRSQPPGPNRKEHEQARASTTLHSGYLIKFAKLKGDSKLKNYKKRYCVLNGSSLMYYGDHKTHMPKGNVLLVGDTVVKDFPHEELENCFVVITPFESIILAAKNKGDLSAWKYALGKAVDYAENALRGYMIKKGTFLEGSYKKFFVLWNNVLSFHENHESTALTQWCVTLSDSSVLKVQDDKLILYIEHGLENVTIQFEQKNAGEYTVWKDAILECIEVFNQSKENEMKEVEGILETAEVNGQLKLRPDDLKLVMAGDGSGPIPEVWTDVLVAFDKDEFTVIDVLEGGDHYKVNRKFPLHRDNRVQSSNLMENAFQIAFLDKIIHLAADTQEEADDWMEMLNLRIQEREDITEDKSGAETLYREALTKIHLDQYYEVVFHERKPLGIVLEKSGEWAIVKIADFKETGIRVGSALCDVDGQSVLTYKYQDVIEYLQDWEAPLTLRFRRAPEMEGPAQKMMSNSGSVWREKYFVLAEGRLSWKKNATSKKALGTIAMQGAVVSIVSSDEFKRFYSIRVLSGIKSVIFDANNVEDYRQWAGVLYHAAAVANGAAYIVNYEVDKAKEEAERTETWQKMQSEANEQYAAFAEKMHLVIDSGDIQELENTVNEGKDLGMEGDFMMFASKRLKMLIEQREQHDYDEHVFQEAQKKTATVFEANAKLEAEQMEMDAMVGGGNGDDDDDDDAFNEMISCNQKRQSRTSIFTKSLITSVFKAKPPPPPPPPPPIEEEEEEEEEEDEGDGQIEITKDMLEGTQVSEADLFYLDPASVDEIRRFYKVFKKQKDEQIGEYFNAVQFSIIWRLVSGEKGNIYNEMQMFNKFDQGKGYMTEEDFTSGWLNLAMEMKSEFYLKKIKFLFGDAMNNIVL